VKPRIDRTNLITTTVKVGKQIFLDVDVAGEPPAGKSLLLISDFHNLMYLQLSQ